MPGSIFEFTFWPTNYYCVTQGFCIENRDLYGAATNYRHEGIDIRCPFGSPYYAVAAGTVIWASNLSNTTGLPSAYGWHVIIDHRKGHRTIYAHAQSNLPVVATQKVVAGDIVGISGNTGNSEGAHLHLTHLKGDHDNGCGVPSGYVNPWIRLQALYNSPRSPRRPGQQGWIWEQNLNQRANNVQIVTMGSYLRPSPNNQDSAIRFVPAGEPAKRLSNSTVNGYALVRVNDYQLDVTGNFSECVEVT